MLLGGAQLLLLHGSAYYALSGLALLATAFWLWRGNPNSIWVYLALLAITWIWALWETGGNGWALVPRTAFLTGLALVFLCPPILRHTGHVRAARNGGRALIGVLALAVVAIAALLIANPSGPVTGGRGTSSRGSMPGRRNGRCGATMPAVAASPRRPRSPPANVGNLAVAWTYETGAAPRPGGAPALAFEVTPLKIGDVLYGCTPHNVLYALDAATGKQIWRHDPQTDDQGLAFANCRGVAYANLAARGMAPAGDPAAACAERIYTGTIDARLLAIDARTGAPCPGFGTNGAVDLRRNIGPHERAYFYYTSAPHRVGQRHRAGFLRVRRPEAAPAFRRDPRL
ncbi:hypothetical protein ACFSTD_12930 [Novosphingobium colocasiae]